MIDHILKAEAVSKRVKTAEQELTILNNVSLDVKLGQSLAIVGPSGAGKSTLLGLLAGLDTPTEGEIWIAGKDITLMDEEGRAAVRAELVGFVFQTFQLLSSLTALENVSLPMELAGEKHAHDKSVDFLKKVGLGERFSHYPKQLSGGEQQRVAIARAFACQPKILFADEPTGNLDQGTGLKISDLLFDLNEQSETTLILVTHEQRLADRCEKTIVIDDGRLVSSR
ncbi:MAG: ABC transporter ATP-binding protein [Arenicella sp.]